MKAEVELANRMHFATKVIALLEQENGLSTADCIAILDLAKLVCELYCQYPDPEFPEKSDEEADR